MATFDYAELAEVAAELLEEFGQEVTLQAAAQVPEYDPATGTVAGGLETSYTVNGAAFDYSSGEIDGAQVQAGDQRCYLASTTTAGVALPEPAPDNRVAVGGVTWRVIRSRPLAPAGTVVMHDVQLRR